MRRRSLGRRLSATGWLLFLLSVLLISSLASSAMADEGEQKEVAPSNPLTPSLIEQAIKSPTDGVETPEPDLQASQELPHKELSRGEALHLLEAVFGPAVESPGGLLDEMPEARFLGDRAAVMRAGEVVEAMSGGPELSAKAAAEPVLVESSVPLRTENEEGHEAPVDLSLEHSEGELQPSNPIVPTGIPAELGEGISLANGDVELTFPEVANERSPSIVEGDASFYPNVQEDSDLIVAPVAGGVETMAQLRTPQAPRTQIVHLNLPDGAVLKETEQGGAEASVNGGTLLNMAPPSAVDAAGNSVPMTVTVSDDNVELTVSPDEETTFPVLADPVWTIENYNWTWGGSSFAGWTPVSYVPSYQPVTYQWGTGIPALDLTSGFPGGATPNTGAQWQFWVPRYASDMAKYGNPPQSFISGVFTEGMMFQLEGNNATWPGLVAGIIDTDYGGWVSNFTWTGANGEFVGWSGHANFYNWYEPNPIMGEPHYAEDTNARVFVYGLITIENEGQAKYRQAVAAKATTEVADHNTPTVSRADGPQGWLNTGQIPINYAASDAGLGVTNLEVVPPGGILNGFGYGSSPEFPVGCTGLVVNPCPREVGSESPPGGPSITVNAATAPEGVDHYRLAAMDPLYSSGFSEGPVPHIAQAPFVLNVDHSPPSLSLAGSLTEQASLGTAKPQYTLKYNASDGLEFAPTYLATSPEGLYNHPAAIVRNSEAFWVADKGNNRLVKVGLSGAILGTYSAVGASDSLKEPAGIDSDAKGNVWVADTGRNRLVEFNSSGEWIRKVGKEGTGSSEFSAPQGIAVAPNGKVWVADTGNSRIEEFTETGTFVGAFGSKGSGNGQFSEPTALAVAPNGNVWVADTGNNRIEVLNGQGEFLASYGSLGSGNGQLNHPVGIQVDTGGSVWVADQNNGRVEQFSERGEYLGQFGAKGTGTAQFSFSGANGITTSPQGALWVIDSANNRLQAWTAPEGTRSGLRGVVVKLDGKEVQPPATVTCPQGGCPLSGEWTLHSGEYSAGAHTVEVTATDGVGLPKTEKLNITLNPPAPTVTLSGTVTEQSTLGYTRPGYSLKVNAAAEEGIGSEPTGPPSYFSFFGEPGTGNGELNHPADAVVDGKGNVWVVDKANNRIQEFNEKGEFVRAAGSLGSGAGQLKSPSAIAIDTWGNLVVADTGNNRVERFKENGEFDSVIGADVNKTAVEKGGTQLEKSHCTWWSGDVCQAGTAGTAEGQMDEPVGLATNAGNGGNVYVVERAANRVDKFNTEGVLLGKFGSLGSGNGQLKEPSAIAIDPNGYLWVADTGNNRVEVFSSSWSYQRQFGSEGAGNGQFKHPVAIEADSNANIWVGDEGNNRVQEFNGVGEFLGKFGSAGSEPGQFSFSAPIGITADSKGNVWVTDPGQNRVEKWNALAYVSSFGAPPTGNGELNHPADAVVDSKGNVWVVDRANNRIQEFNENGEFIRAAGSLGSGAGQLNSPSAIAIDTWGNLAVADTGNNRVVRFDPEGKFRSVIGANVNKTKVESGGTLGERNRCAAESGDVCQAGIAGTAEGLMNEPMGIATSTGDGGLFYVVERANNRVEKFNLNGEVQAKFGSLGSGNGQLKEPTAIAIGPNGHLWVADTGNNRIERWNSSWVYQSQFGSQGSSYSQFKRPDAIDVDSSGNVWVADEGNSRIQELSETGEFLNSFGSAGAGAGKFLFSAPIGIAVDGAGNVWVTDPGNNRIDRWRRPARSRVTTEVTVDGKAVDMAEARCTTETCPITRELRLESPAGTHTLVVKAADGYGQWTSKTRTFKVEADTTKPTLQVGGELANAPEGWVQQESYGLYAKGTDPGGYGVTSLLFRIDGTTVASTTKSCPEGGCEATIEKGINMAPYSGGAHEAEVIATDGAGNSESHHWTINVDPEGHISTAEATATLEALESTSDSNLIGESEEEEGVEGTADGLGLEATESGFASTGAQAPMTAGSNPSEPMIVEVPEASELYSCGGKVGETEATPEESGETEESKEECIPPSEEPQGEPEPVPVAVTPLNVGEEGSMHLVEENAALAPNTGSSWDTVIRPLNDGGMIFQAIRDDSAPETYSYRVTLGARQELRQIDETHVQVYYSSGSPGFLISAETAHDAIGTAVPTSLEITREDVVTLTVHYRAGHEGQPFVYPIVGGTGWEGGFITESAYFGLSNPPEGGGEGSSEEASENGGSVTIMAIGPPELVAHSSDAWEIEPLMAEPFERRFKFTYCWPKHIPGNPAPPGSFEGLNRPQLSPETSECHREDFEGVRWATTVHGHYEYKTHHWVRVHAGTAECGGWGEQYPTKVHCKVIGVGLTSGPADVIGEWRFAPGRGEWQWLAKPTCYLFGGEIYPREAPSGGHVPYERPPVWFREPLTYAPEACDWETYEKSALRH